MAKFPLILPVVALLLAPGSLTRAQMPTADRTFTNPVYSNAADPFITFYQGRYYLLSTDLANDAFEIAGPHRLTVTSSPSLATLSTGTSRTVCQIVNNPKAKHPHNQFYESPEIYRFGDRWFLYYTEYPNTTHVLESAGEDPQGDYHYKATLNTNTYDSSVLIFPDGRLYLLGSTYGHLVIQKLANPYTVEGPQTQIAKIDQKWETVVIEAPQPVWHEGRLSLLYASGGYNKKNYGVGCLKFRGGDPLRAESWAKVPGPIFQGQLSANVWCAGVACPFTSPDGKETWFAYSDYSLYNFAEDEGAGPRTIMAQPLTWNADHTPNLGQPIPLSQKVPLPSGDPGR